MRRAAAVGTATVVLLTACGVPEDGRVGTRPPVTAPRGDDPTREPDGLGPTGTVAPDPAAVAAAIRFVRAWARPHLSAGRWLADVRAYAVPGYADILDTVDPAQVPATRVVGPGQVALAIADRTDVDVPTDAGFLRVTVVRTEGRWLVATIGRRDQGGAR
ncbi:hypothetical protein [Micromonospora sp. SH-82]|uniref:hypothetical protein n=1 Tax=Micromonospora sp. SH-82 TaxID=3132938 RepID=UPI003EC0D9AE